MSKRTRTPLEVVAGDINLAALRLRIGYPSPLAAMRRARDELVNARAMLAMEIAVLDNQIAEASRTGKRQRTDRARSENTDG